MKNALLFLSRGYITSRNTSFCGLSLSKNKLCSLQGNYGFIALYKWFIENSPLNSLKCIVRKIILANSISFINFVSQSTLMDSRQQHLDQLTEIRSLMERSTRFISLSGLSGIVAGIFALMGAAAAYWYYDIPLTEGNISVRKDYDTLLFFFIDAAVVLVLSVAAGVVLTIRQAKKKNEKIWDKTSKRLLINLAVPLITGGLFSLVLLDHYPPLIASAMLIFYGLALLNGSKYTLDDVRYLGYCQIALGLINAFIGGYGLLFWALGFGLLHIIYGAVMYRKYER